MSTGDGDGRSGECTIKRIVRWSLVVVRLGIVEEGVGGKIMTGTVR